MSNLRHLLNDLAGDVGTYDVVDQAWQSRHRGRRRLAAVGGGFAVVAAVLAVTIGVVAARPDHRPPAAQPSATPSASASPTPTRTLPTVCAGALLPIPAGVIGTSAVNGADPSGRLVVGGTYEGGVPGRALIWDNGTVKAVTIPGDDFGLYDITSTGIAIGSSSINGKQVGWVYRNGALTQLKGNEVQVTAISDHGVIVGAADNQPAVWTSADADPTFLPLPAGRWTGYATGIDEDGTIVGRATDGAAPLVGRAFIWRGTERTELPPVVDPAAQATYVYSNDIRGGWVTGVSDQIISDDRTEPRATRWNLATGQRELLQMAAPGPINRNGWMAGTQAWKLVLTDGHAVLTLPQIPGQVPPPEHAAPIESVASISDDGKILAGTVTMPGDKTAAVVWHAIDTESRNRHCGPAPAVWSAAVGAAGGSARRPHPGSRTSLLTRTYRVPGCPTVSIGGDAKSKHRSRASAYGLKMPAATKT